MSTSSILQRSLFALALWGAGQAPPVFAASFNCARASGCTEVVICETPQLSRLDSRMARLYSDLQDSSSLRGAARLLGSQKVWLESRNSCGCNANCLVSKYESRIRLFEDALASD